MVTNFLPSDNPCGHKTHCRATIMYVHLIFFVLCVSLYFVCNIVDTAETTVDSVVKLINAEQLLKQTEDLGRRK